MDKTEPEGVYATHLERWCRLATTAEKQALAEAIGTSYDYAVFHLAKGRREPDAALAAKIEAATAAIGAGASGKLFTVYRTELNAACRGCAFARKCLGPAAEAAEFPVAMTKD